MPPSDIIYATFSPARVVVGATALALAMVLCAILGRQERAAAVALAALSVAWLVFDSAFEGPTLIVFDSAHGLTTADLVAFLGLIVAAWELLRPRR